VSGSVPAWCRCGIAFVPPYFSSMPIAIPFSSQRESDRAQRGGSPHTATHIETLRGGQAAGKRSQGNNAAQGKSDRSGHRVMTLIGLAL